MKPFYFETLSIRCDFASHSAAVRWELHFIEFQIVNLCTINSCQELKTVKHNSLYSCC